MTPYDCLKSLCDKPTLGLPKNIPNTSESCPFQTPCQGSVRARCTLWNSVRHGGEAKWLDCYISTKQTPPKQSNHAVAATSNTSIRKHRLAQPQRENIASIQRAPSVFPPLLPLLPLLDFFCFKYIHRHHLRVDYLRENQPANRKPIWR